MYREDRPSDAPLDPALQILAAEIAEPDPEIIEDIEGEIQALRVRNLLEMMPSQFLVEMKYAYVSEPDALGKRITILQTVEQVGITVEVQEDGKLVATATDEAIEEAQAEMIVEVQLMITEANGAELSRLTLSDDDPVIDDEYELLAFAESSTDDDAQIENLKATLLQLVLSDEKSLEAKTAEHSAYELANHIADTRETVLIEAIESGLVDYNDLYFNYAFTSTLTKDADHDYEPGSEYSHVFTVLDEENMQQFVIILSSHVMTIDQHLYDPSGKDLFTEPMGSIKPPYISEDMDRLMELLDPLLIETEKLAR